MDEKSFIKALKYVFQAKDKKFQSSKPNLILETTKVEFHKHLNSTMRGEEGDL